MPELLEKLIEQIKREGVQRDPVIVDENSMVVLDGMHRIEALKAIGCKLIAVCFIDYSDPRVAVNTWWRTVKGDVSLIYDVLKNLNFKFQIRSRPSSLESVRLPAIFLMDEIVEVESSGVYDSHLKMKALEHELKKLGFNIGYEVEGDALVKLNMGECTAVIGLPLISKDQVVRVALSGSVFPHKSTRHVIPFRPLSLNVPLRMLMLNDCEEANELFLRLVRARRGRLLPPQVFKGRRYEEYLYVFEGV